MVGKDKLVKIVGKKNVFDSPDVLEQYAGDVNCHPRIRPGCVVKPANNLEVQEIVKWANEAHTSLVPVSSGTPHTREDTIPGMGGTVVVDLTRMKKIMRVDPNNRVAWVEPGVTFAELQPELEKAGFSTYMPLCPRSSKSVINEHARKRAHYDARAPLGLPRSLSVRRNHLRYRGHITQR